MNFEEAAAAGLAAIAAGSAEPLDAVVIVRGGGGKGDGGCQVQLLASRPTTHGERLRVTLRLQVGAMAQIVAESTDPKALVDEIAAELLRLSDAP